MCTFCLAAAALVAPSSTRGPSALLLAASVDARATASPLHVARCSLVNCSPVPTSRRRVKGGVSSPTEDLRLVSEVEAGVNFRPAGEVRKQVVVHSPGRRPGPGTRWSRGGAVAPPVHPEAPDSICVTWTWIGYQAINGTGGRCVVPQGGRMLPTNLDPTIVCVRTRMDMEEQSDHKLMTPSGMV